MTCFTTNISLMLSTYETGIVMFLKECSCKVRKVPWKGNFHDLQKTGQIVVTRDICLKLPEWKKNKCFFWTL